MPFFEVIVLKSAEAVRLTFRLTAIANRAKLGCCFSRRSLWGFWGYAYYILVFAMPYVPLLGAMATVPDETIATPSLSEDWQYPANQALAAGTARLFRAKGLSSEALDFRRRALKSIIIWRP